jgi:hypothetical protein
MRSSQMHLTSPLEMHKINLLMGLPWHLFGLIRSSSLGQKTTTIHATSFGFHTCL